jgi:phage replication-related protein YjqB (UPF0714/DUF867 family)
MADKYRNFRVLSRNETAGIDYQISVRRARDAFAIVAPHGGGIEPGTSEIADAIADGDFSMYAFDGIKSSGNSDLHITSTRFDEPMCITLITESDVVLTIHGEHSDEDGEGVFLGGRNKGLGKSVAAALEAADFVVRQHPDPGLQGLERRNLCNRGQTGKGVQLELSRTIRRAMFASLTREGRKTKTEKFHTFVGAVRGVLEKESSRAVRAAATQH